MQFVMIGAALFSLAWSQANPPAPQDPFPYTTPAFDDFFPDDVEGGRALDAFWTRRHARTPHPDRDLPIIRRGLRRTTVPRTSILRWVGNKFIWEKNPQQPEAIQIMLHAADPRASADAYGTRHNAVFFGLSVIRPKSETILQSLAEVCLATDGADTIGRAMWGCRDQQEAWLERLQTLARSERPEVAAKGDALLRIARGEISAQEWAEEHRKQQALAAFRDEVPTWRATLLEGASATRQALLQSLIEREAIPALDEGFLPALTACLGDEDPAVRALAAQVVGQRWCGKTLITPPAAVAWLLAASRDSHPEVRLAAVWHGLSTIQGPNDAVVERLLELARHQPSSDMAQRVRWALTYTRASALRLLEGWIVADDLPRAHWAYEYFERFANRPPSVQPPGQVQLADLAGTWRLDVRLGPDGPEAQEALVLQVEAVAGQLPRLTGSLGGAPLEHSAWARRAGQLEFGFDCRLQGQDHAIAAVWDGRSLRGTARVRGAGLMLFWSAQRVD